jgi:hypothetical protein
MSRPKSKAKANAKAEQKLWGKEAKEPSGFDIAIKRQRDVNVLLADRHGGTKDDFAMPDDEMTRRILPAVLPHHIRYENPERRILNWLCKHCPWMAAEEMWQLVRSALRAQGRIRSDAHLGKLFGLSYEDMRRLKITTMLPPNMTRAQVRARSKDALNERRRKAARAAGVKPREEYEAQGLNKTKPWVALGIKKRWYFELKRRGQLPGADGTAQVPSDKEGCNPCDVPNQCSADIKNDAGSTEAGRGLEAAPDQTSAETERQAPRNRASGFASRRSASEAASRVLLATVQRAPSLMRVRIIATAIKVTATEVA